MLGDLPSDFLRIQLLEPHSDDASPSQQEHDQYPDFLGHITLTIAEVSGDSLLRLSPSLVA